jgi:Fe-S-cluster-containing hydrogenase component 2
MICSLTHEDVIDIKHSRIQVSTDPFKGTSSIIVCNQCYDAPCYYACPESAIEFNQTNGAVRIEKEKCIGCRQCEKVCPYNAIQFSEKDHKAYKCDLCNGKINCVNWCPMNALGISVFGGEIY